MPTGFCCFFMDLGNAHGLEYRIIADADGERLFALPKDVAGEIWLENVSYERTIDTSTGKPRARNVRLRIDHR